MRRAAAPVLVALLVMCVFAGGCRVQKRDVHPRADYSGLTLTVWDVSQPRVNGLPDYAEEARGIAEEFGSRYGVKVDLRFAGRQEVADMLLGKAEGPRPDIVCTGEWPFIPVDASDVSGLVAPEDYVEFSLAYWQRDGGLWAIPAYAHWTGSVHRKSSAGGVYFWDSPIFLTAATAAGGIPCDPEEIVSYLRWVLQEWGEPRSDPLLWWEEGGASSLYPATPHMWQRLKSSGGEVSLGPVRRPSGESYFYSVPAYLVLAKDSVTKSCAFELATLLAGNLGRWAARALSCVPARREDVSLFNIESGLGYEERSAMLSSLSETGLRAPTSEEFLEWSSLEEPLREIAADFLSGRVSEDKTKSLIRETLQRHTKP